MNEILPESQKPVNPESPSAPAGAPDPAPSRVFAPPSGGANPAGQGVSPSLDIYGHSSTRTYSPELNRQQKRLYHRALSWLNYAQGHQKQVLWVMLSSPVGADQSVLAYNHKRLRQEIERKKGFKGLEHLTVRTEEGNGVLHALWAWGARPGERQRQFYISQAWLSETWARISGAPVVWIKKVHDGDRDYKKIARYIVTQYVTEQQGFVNFSWSWWRTFGFPMGAIWSAFKQEFHGKERYFFWRKLMQGEDVIDDNFKRVNLSTIRRFYSRWRDGEAPENSYQEIRRWVGAQALKAPFSSYSLGDMAQTIVESLEG